MPNKLACPRGPQLEKREKQSFDLDTLPEDLVKEFLRFLLVRSPDQALSLACTSKTLHTHLEEVLSRSTEMKEALKCARDHFSKKSLQEAKDMLGQSQPALFTALWIGSSLAAALAITEEFEEWPGVNFYPTLVLAYFVATFTNRWNEDAVKVMRLMFDFSLSYAGNVFITVQVNSAQTMLALVIAVMSTVHALILSMLMMSASVQASLWRDLDNTLHKTQSILMLLFYIGSTIYYGGIPNVWKLSSACSRLFMLIHISWTWILPKLGEMEVANPDIDGNNGSEHGSESEHDGNGSDMEN